MHKAYEAESGVVYDPASGTLAVAGTRNGRDWATDALYALGAEGAITSRFDTVKQAVGKYHPSRMVGHSLGGAVVSQYTGKKTGGHGIHTVGYDPYVLPWRQHPDESYSDILDPVSVFAPNNKRLHLAGHWIPHSLSSLGS